jgi:hypothetical protein
MPVTYTLDSGLLVITATGSYPPDEVIQAFHRAIADPACPNPVALLYDPSASADLAGRTPAQIRMVANFLKPHAERIGRRLGVVVGNDVQFGLSRVGAVFAEAIGVEARIFRSAAEAREWLASGPRRTPPPAST